MSWFSMAERALYYIYREKGKKGSTLIPPILDLADGAREMG
jgi:hypothetical protein